MFCHKYCNNQEVDYFVFETILKWFLAAKNYLPISESRSRFVTLPAMI